MTTPTQTKRSLSATSARSCLDASLGSVPPPFPPGGVVAGVWREHPTLKDDDPVSLTGRLLALAVEPIDRDTAARLLGITAPYAGVVLSRLAGAGRLEVVDVRPKRYRARAC